MISLLQAFSFMLFDVVLILDVTPEGIQLTAENNNIITN